MKNKQLFTLFSITVIFVFITSLVSTVNVLADDSTPPAPTEEPVSTEEPVATEEPVSTEESAATEVPAAETESAPTPEVDTPAEVLESVPEGMDVVVLDENGAPISLVTEEAAQIIMAGDPMWCPDGQTPGTDMDDSAQDCTDPYPNDFAGLVADLTDGGYAGSGTIFVAHDYSGAEGEIVLDHASGSLTSLNNLVIQGGWDFVEDEIYDNPAYQSTLNGTWLFIGNWVGNVTVNNIFVQNSDYNGLFIQTDGDVSLNYVEVDNSDLAGAFIEADGNVTVTNSEFTDNGHEGYYDVYDDGDTYSASYEASPGLWVSADGNVTLNDVYAADNGGNGATIFGSDVEITESTFEENGWGEYDGYGAYWEDIEYDDGDEYGYFTVIYGGNGLDVDATGEIKINDIEATGNGGDGAYLESQDGVTVIDSEFVYNGAAGFLGEGFYETEEYGSAGGGIRFDYGNGLTINSGGNVRLSQVGAYANSFHGVEVDTSGSLFVEESEFISNGEFVSIGGEGGLFGEFLCYGEIFGEEIDLCSQIELPVSGFDLEMGFSESGFGLRLDFDSGSGLYGDASGNITLVDVLAEHNLGFGVDVYSGGDINVSESEFYENGYGFSGELGFVATEDYTEFEAFVTNGSGLYAEAENDITLSHVIADGNVLHGAELYSGAVNSVFVEESEFNGNGYGDYLGDGGWLDIYHYEDSEEYIDEYDSGYGSGLYIESAGNVILVNVDANGNNQDGAEVYSDGGRVIVSCGQYDGNGEYGIYEDGASSLELYGPEILGNGNSPDEYFFGGGLILSDDCLQGEGEGEGDGGHKSSVIIPVTGGEKITCGAASANVTVNLPNGDFVILPCPLNEFALVDPTLREGLPNPLEDDLHFISALTALVIRENQPVELLNEPMTVSFLIPEGVDTETLAILFWDGTEWTELGGELSADGLHFEVSTKLVGTFVLVSK